jgi:glycosyltransferase involved in cell wall biosynthesis
MLEMQKNISGMLNVVKRLQDEDYEFEMLMVGGGAEKYRSKANSLGIQEDTLKLKNQVEHSALIQYFQEADVFVLFSEDENLPCVILESFACGTPVISTDVGGLPEYFPSNFGRLIPRGDEDALYKAIKETKLDDSIASADEMHDYAQKNFSPESIATQFSDIYYKSLKN